MKTIINGFEVEYSEELVGLDTLAYNPHNSRTQEECDKNAKRIYESMRPLIPGSKERLDNFQELEFKLYIAGDKNTTVCGNGSFGALKIWSDSDPDSFLSRFPDRMIPVRMFHDLSRVELLALAADHSEGFRPQALSTEQTAKECRRMMTACKKDELAAICRKLGYSSGKCKPYYHLEVARRSNEELYDILFAGAISEDDTGNLIKLSSIPQIAARWTKSSDRKHLKPFAGDNMSKDNTELWKAVTDIRDFGKIGSTEKALTAVEKLDVEILTLKEKVESLESSIKEEQSFLASVASVECADTTLQKLLDSMVESNLGPVKTTVRSLNKRLETVK